MKTEKSECEKEVIAYRCLYEECQDVPTSIGCTYVDLPDTLIAKYGDYKVFDKIYSLDQDGLYRFNQLYGASRQVIIYGGEDIDNLISALSWVTIHGNNDNKLSFKEKNEKSLYSKLVMTCGYTAQWASVILRGLGVKNRMVMSLTLDEWNSYDNGHTLLEVYREDIGKWVVYDIDNGIVFLYGSDYMNIVELCDHVSSDRAYQIRYLSSAARYTDQSEYAFLYEKILSGETNMRKWLKRMLQVPMIRNEDGNYYFFDRDNRGRIETYAKTFLYMERDEFMNRNYSI